MDREHGRRHAVALSPFDQAKLTIAELLDYSVFRWPAENCPLLDQRLPSLPAVSQQNIQRVSSFEMIALWVAAGYGVGYIPRNRALSMRRDGAFTHGRCLTDPTRS